MDMSSSIEADWLEKIDGIIDRLKQSLQSTELKRRAG